MLSQIQRGNPTTTGCFFLSFICLRYAYSNGGNYRVIYSFDFGRAACCEECRYDKSYIHYGAFWHFCVCSHCPSIRVY